MTRHLAGGSHAEDLGFTDQVLWNFLRGQWFRMSLYQGATWNTEIDLSHLARPDSLLAFHVEPMLLLFVPLYALGMGPTGLLVIQAVGVALGAIPAYRLAQHATRSAPAGLAVAAAYLLAPAGQWAVLSDFHTSTLAAPLLLFAVERFVVAQRPVQGFVVIALALSAREDVGPVVALLGLSLPVVLHVSKRVGISLIALGTVWSLVCAAVIGYYSGGVSPFGMRYGAALGDGLTGLVQTVGRQDVLGYLGLLLLNGGWLGLLAPLAWLPALPALLLNVLASSPWMASGKAHYSSLVLPVLVLGIVAGLRRLGRLGRLGRLRRHHHDQRAVNAACLLLALGAVVGYAQEGAGPLGGNYAPARLTAHPTTAESLAHLIPAQAKVSASSTLVPRLSQRPVLYLFPAVLDADFVFVDVKVSAAPTSPGDAFLRLQELAQSGGWRVLSDASSDGLLLLERDPAAAATLLDDLARVWFAGSDDGSRGGDGTPRGDSGPRGDETPRQAGTAVLLASPDGAIDVDGPRGILRTTWQLDQPVPPGTRLEFWIDLDSGERLHVWDIAGLWWYPPERWPVGTPVTVDVPDIPRAHFVSWQAEWNNP